MKTIIAALFLAALPGCLSDIDPSLPQQIEQQAEPQPSMPICPMVTTCGNVSTDAGTVYRCHGYGPPALQCKQLPKTEGDPCFTWDCVLP